jgi:hypothetical protein
MRTMNSMRVAVPDMVRWTIGLAIAAVGAGMVTPVVAAERLSDKDVKALLDQIDDERDRFEDQLDGTLKRSVIRGPKGEVNVSSFLDDLQENVDKLKGRFAPKYAASAEVTTLLQQGSAIHRFMATRPAGFDGASEWNRLSSSLGALASAYSTTFPVAEGATARRLNDQEVKEAALQVAEGADQFKKDLDSSLKKAKAAEQARKAAVKEVDALKREARGLADIVGDGRPASSEAVGLIQHAGKLRTASSGWALSPQAQTSWRSVEEGLDKIGQAFQQSVR